MTAPGARLIRRLSPAELAGFAPFALGTMTVDPASRRMSGGGRSETLEPRMMQVLIALAHAEGAVLSRDRLIELCWDGRIVGDNAINRVLSRLRQVFASLGGGSVEIETITKVGYRLLVHGEQPAWPRAFVSSDDDRAPRAAASPPRFGRRAIAGFALAGIAAAGTGAAWFGLARNRPHPEAQALFERGEIAQRQGLPDQTMQAVSYYREAVRIDPDFAAAWGGLALAHRHVLEGYGRSEAGALPRQIASAATRALTLDPDNADALLALQIILPYYRNWLTMAPALRALNRRFPDHWLATAQHGLVLQDVGRLDEGVTLSQRVVAIDPFLPVARGLLVRALSCAGRAEEADGASLRALARWPNHPILWHVRHNTLLYNGRPDAADAFLANPDHRPPTAPDDQIADMRRIIAAISGRRPADVAWAIERSRETAVRNISSATLMVPQLVLLGELDLAFRLLGRYFLGSTVPGEEAAPPGRYDRRYTIVLFSPPLHGLTGDPRFAALLERTGLEDYWRRSGSVPDFRRA